MCVLINIQTCKVVDSYQSACAGEWNEKNEWYYDKEVRFSPVLKENPDDGESKEE